MIKYSDLKKIALPSYTLPWRKRDTSNTDYIIVLPIFEAFDGITPIYHLNSAMWVYNSLIVNSNLLTTGIPVVFYIEDRCLDNSDINRMLFDGNIPDEQIWEFNRIETDRFSSWYVGLKMCPLWDTRFDNFENVLIWDTDLLLGSYNSNILNIHTLFRRNQPSQPGAVHVNIEKAVRMRLYNTHRVTSKVFDSLHRQITRELTAREYDDLYSIGGFLHSFCPKKIKQSYKDFYKKALPIIGDDESILSLWSIHYQEEVEDIATIIPKLAFNNNDINHIIEFPVFNPYLSHLYFYENLDIPRWKKSVGILEE